MPISIRLPLGLAASLCLSSFAFAEPPTVENNAEVLMEKVEETFSKHQLDIAKSAAKLKRTMESAKSKTGDVGADLEVMADVLEDAFAEDGVFRDLAAMFSDFASEIDVDTDNGKTVLRFDGTEVGAIEHHTSRNSEDSFSISGLGKSLSMGRETIVEDGKSKTRIIIDMEGEEIDITLPELGDLKPSQ